MPNDSSIQPQDNFISEVSNAAESGSCQISAEAANQRLVSDEQMANDLIRKEKKADINLKLIYGIVILLVLIGWEVFVVAYSCKMLNPDGTQVRQMSDAVIIALWTSATANIVALPTIILNYLFPKHREH